MSAESGENSAGASSIDVFTTTHRYKGVNLAGVQLPQILEDLKDWTTRDDDVYIVIYPKSGTHWILEVAYLIVNDVDVSKIDRTHMVYAIDLALSGSIDGLATITTGADAMTKWESPRIMPTHILEEFTPDQIKKSKIIYFCRNPKDVAVSWFTFLGHTLPGELQTWEGFLPYFLSEEMMTGSWFRHVKGWWKHKDSPNVLLCKYEDFHKDLKGSVKRVADFMGRPLTEEKLNKIVELTEMKGMRKTYQQMEDEMGEEGKSYTRLFSELPYLRKGKVGSWKDKFTVAQNEYFDKVYKENMDGTGIEFDFEL